MNAWKMRNTVWYIPANQDTINSTMHQHSNTSAIKLNDFYEYISKYK